MDEEVKTGETNEAENTSAADSNPDVGQQTEQMNNAEFTDSAEEGAQANVTEDASDVDKPSQTPEQNSANARRRREEERQRELQAARDQAIMEALGGVNPFTGDEMKDSADVKEFMTMRKIKAAGGDPLSDFSKFQKAQEREAQEAAAQEAAQAESCNRDIDDFRSKYPNVDLAEILNSEDFAAFAQGKVGNMPLSKIYEDYTAFTSRFEKKAHDKANQILANANSTPGALKSPNAPDNGYFTREQVAKMSQDEVRKNYDKIRESMTKWK